MRALERVNSGRRVGGAGKNRTTMALMVLKKAKNKGEIIKKIEIVLYKQCSTKCYI